MTMRAERIAEIRKRTEKATPGSWRSVWDDHPILGGCCLVNSDNRDIAMVEWDADAEADAAFIAHARQDVPWLLEEVGRLEHLLRTFAQGPAAVMIGDPE